MTNSKTRKLLLYEAPEVNLVKIDASCSVMQASVTALTTFDIPDIEETDINNWL